MAADFEVLAVGGHAELVSKAKEYADRPNHVTNAMLVQTGGVLGDVSAIEDILYDERSTSYNTGALTGYTISNTSRWFLNGEAQGTITKVSLKSKLANKNVKVEIWERDGNTLTKAFEKDATISTAYAYNDIEIGYSSSHPMMVSLQPDTDAVNQITDTSKGFNAYYTADKTSETLSIDSLRTFPGLCVIGYSVYEVNVLGDLESKVSVLEDFINNDNVTTVMQGGGGDYDSIADAVSAATDGDVIVVYPGTYTEPIEAWGKTIDIIGIDKASCIIKNSTGNYSTPAIEIDSGRIANLTIVSDAASPTCTPSDTSDYMLDYSIHADNSHASGKTLIIEDCIIRNNHRAALGIGLYQDNTVVVRNCDVWSGKPPADISNPLWNKRGAVYFHNRAPSAYFSNVTGQLIRFINNTFYCEDIIALYIGDTCKDVDMQAQGWVNEASAEFVGNMFCAKDANGDYKTTSNGITTPTAFSQDSIIGGAPFSENLELSAISYGNNLTYLNA